MENRWVRRDVYKRQLVYLLEPFMHPNLKYGVKAPKVYFTDTGLAAYLLRWSNAEILEAGAMSSSFLEDVYKRQDQKCKR